MLSYHLKIGLLPVRRWIQEPPKRIGMFQSDYAVENKNMAVRYIRERYTDQDTEFVDLDFLNEEGVLCLEEDCPRVVEYFQEQKIDALFVINCNFGMENVVGLVAGRLKLPTLLWGPRDRHFENGSRTTDTQCGLFAISKQLRRANVKFSYIENCDITSAVFDRGLRKFLSVATMVRNFYHLTVLQVGSRVKPFSSVMYNELEMTERFGLHVRIFNLAEAMAALERLHTTRADALERDVAELKRMYDCGSLSDAVLKKMLTVVYYYEELAATYQCNLISSECWSGITVGFGVNPCLAMSLLADRGIYVSCEWDMHMCVTTALLLSAARGSAVPLQGELTSRHPDNENGELLWHCGPFPLSMKAEGERPCLYNTKPSFRVKDGIYTMARFQCDGGKYYLFGTRFHTCEGPRTFGTYLWAQFSDLPRLERKLIEGPYIHHMTEIYGDYTEELEEFCRFVDDVIFDSVD